MFFYKYTQNNFKIPKHTLWSYHKISYMQVLTQKMPQVELTAWGILPKWIN